MQPSRFEVPIGVDAWLPQIESVFEGIDRAYQQVAEACAFQCTGCEDTCCRSHFYHHTFLEFILLREGFRQLPDRQQAQMVRQAQRVCREVEGGAVKILCPLNTGGICSLYHYRPMICRMHGVPHKLYHPARGWLTGPGCDRFPAPEPGADSPRFDRTPFYRRVARLEQEIKADLDLDGRMRMTVAEMVTLFPVPLSKLNDPT